MNEELRNVMCVKFGQCHFLQNKYFLDCTGVNVDH
jgi:hypothetical protein